MNHLHHWFIWFANTINITLQGGRGNEFKYIFNIIGSCCGGWFGHPGNGEG
jgi:hypothetical protein